MTAVPFPGSLDELAELTNAVRHQFPPCACTSLGMLRNWCTPCVHAAKLLTELLANSKIAEGLVARRQAREFLLAMERSP